MSATVSITGILKDPASMRRWSLESHQKIRRTVLTEFTSGQSDLRQAADSAVRAGFRVNKRSFPAAWRTRVYASRPLDFPAVLLQSKIFWMGAQEYGADIIGRNGVLIPFGGVRIGFKEFRDLLATLRENGQGFFKQTGGRVILFARARVGLKGGAVARLKRAFAQSRSSTIGVSRNQAFPVAILVPRVRLRPRYSLDRATAPVLRKMARAIEAQADF